MGLNKRRSIIFCICAEKQLSTDNQHVQIIAEQEVIYTLLLPKFIFKVYKVEFLDWFCSFWSQESLIAFKIWQF